MDLLRTKFFSTKSLAIAALACITSSSVFAATLPVGPENQAWSDLFLGSPSGSYDSGMLDFTATVSGAGDLEIGSEFGPDNPGRHYGPNPNDAGGPFIATLNVTDVMVDNAGQVIDGGSVVLTFGGSAPGSIGDDYGILPGATLLEGFVTEVLLGATGAGTLDVLFEITGGALQTQVNADVNFARFSPIGVGLMRFVGLEPPVTDWTQDFTLDMSTLNTFGLPEPSSALMFSTAAIAGVPSRTPSCWLISSLKLEERSGSLRDKRNGKESNFLNRQPRSLPQQDQSKSVVLRQAITRSVYLTQGTGFVLRRTETSPLAIL